MPKFKSGDDIDLFGVGLNVRNVTLVHLTKEPHYVLASYADSDPTRQTHVFLMPCYWIDNLAESVNIS